ncbi:MFS transporter [Tianweitania populi]|uniref:MFS transporter n=1 Tax=Tianweitania populi TaxID=1607949 RepID=A0A8J3DQW1_9HYPH|nr:MFS transporter [Tianweitania populi]GHD17981.1 MFS transporter [Tianweitania populi]
MTSTAPTSPAAIDAKAATGKGIWGWMLFDWAAQPFFTVVTTFIFGPYFVSRMVEDPAVGQAAWGYGIAAAGLVIAILSPVLGSVADQTGRRKIWIGIFAFIKITSLILLWWAAPGSNLFWPLLVFALASVAAEFSIVFNDSMLPRLGMGRDIGRISNLAWGLGYAGGMVVLIFVVGFIAGTPDTGRTLLGFAPLLGLDPAAGEDARATGPIAAIWYLVFILPMFLFTPDTRTGTPVGKAMKQGLGELRDTLTEVRGRPGILRFLVARMIFQDGVNALIALGGTFAALLFSWSVTEIGLFGIILNVAAIIGCLTASRLDNRFGSKVVVVLSLVILIVATLGVASTSATATLFGLLPLGAADVPGLFGSTAEKAYIFYGLMIGVAFGPVQASSRAYLARSIPPENAGRYFGLYALAGRATSFVAPFVVATVTALSGSPAAGMATIILFLAVGLAILLRTPYPADKVDASTVTRP